jgi:hypothetical protein
MLVISELLPKVQELQASRHKTNTAVAITDFLGNVNLKHVLPPAPALVPRKFLVSSHSPCRRLRKRTHSLAVV